MKIRKNHSPILFLFIIVAITSLCMSLVISAINLGLTPNFLQLWARIYGIAFVITLSTAFVATRIAEKVVTRLTSWKAFVRPLATEECKSPGETSNKLDSNCIVCIECSRRGHFSGRSTSDYQAETQISNPVLSDIVSKTIKLREYMNPHYDNTKSYWIWTLILDIWFI